MIADSTNDSLRPVLLWSVVLIGFLLAGFALVSWLKRRLHQPDEQVSMGFSLADLRDLHRKGQISTEEYDRARAKLVASLKTPVKTDKTKTDQNKVPPTNDSPPTAD